MGINILWWSLIALYMILGTIYFFAAMVIAVDENATPFYIFSKESYDIVKTPMFVLIITWESLMLPWQLFLLSIYAVVQIHWNLVDAKEEEKKKRLHQLEQRFDEHLEEFEEHKQNQ